ncbi:MAG TPA: hypothetical protein ENG86_05805, partial [Nitrospirae bacterium]|nr:hypothetical protein [Nitrospirota bacterium]
AFYRKLFLYSATGLFFIYLATRLLSAGMSRLHDISPAVFPVLLVKGYSLIFMIIFVIQIINGLVFALNSFFQSRDLGILMPSPVNRTALFFSRLLETQVKASWMLVIFGLPLLVSAGIYFRAGILYYFFSVVCFIVFSSIAVTTGTIMGILLSGIFNSGRMKKFLFSTGIISIAAIITLVRILKPERFVNPELFANLSLFLNGLRTSSFILLPNRWLSESIFGFLNGRYTGLPLFTGMLVLTSYLTAILALFIFGRYHEKGWRNAFERGAAIRRKPGRHSGRVHTAKSPILLKLMPFRDKKSRALAFKDIIYQIRDIRNIHQLLILVSLIIVYMFSIASIPLNWENINYALKLRYFVTFFNLGLIAIILAAICSRIVHPSIVAEKESFWLLKTSPLTPGRYVWTKLIFFFVPIMAFGLLLTLFSSYFVHIGKVVFALKLLTTVLLSLSLVSLAVAFGIIDMGKLLKEDTKEEIKTGNTLYMIISVMLILLTMTLELIPVYLSFLKESQKVFFIMKTWLVIGAAAAIIAALNIIIITVSIRLAIKKFEKLELS